MNKLKVKGDVIILFEKLSELIEQFSKLEKIYIEKIEEGYTLTHISVRASSPKKAYDFKSIDIVMQHTNGENLLISTKEGIVEGLFIEKVTSEHEKSNDLLILSHKHIHNKSFKRKLFGGYDIDEVNNYLDIITKDYKIIENILIKENKNYNKED